ncbi:tolloid-like protein 1 [Mercenaria mercenaria]|uniref:tolloid-like protein 1 n=1 Tax=Mercenaria mercenaria TaxID=6596 RepID=UPI00234F6DC1|nr:tolloid-like protein 1 [Mercenaria mercenaria]
MEIQNLFFALLVLFVPLAKTNFVENLSATPEHQPITSPNWPLRYPANSNCTWIIKAEDPRCVVCIKFDFFFLDGYRTCSHDRVKIDSGEISENNGALGIFCGNPKTGFPVDFNPFIGEICVNGSAVIITFESDSSYHYNGFRLEYYTKECDLGSGNACKGNGNSKGKGNASKGKGKSKGKGNASKGKGKSNGKGNSSKGKGKGK